MQTGHTMKALPPSERPYERCLEKGPGALSDAELLAVILRSGSRELSSLETARLLLDRFGAKKGLAFLSETGRRELESVPGIGPVKAVSLLCIGELSRRIAASSRRSAVSLKTPESIASYFMEEMRHLDHEELAAVFFDTKNRLLGHRVLSVGTVNASLASAREIFLEALRQGAACLVLLHNHPSGDPTPSQDDLRMTGRICEAGKLMEIPVLDHIIIGDRKYVSLREQGLLQF